MRFRRYLFAALILFSVASVATFLLVAAPIQKIYLTDSGYVPKESTIRAGTTVIFYNYTTTPFWPASNTHPEHTQYPDFDPQSPMPAGGNWSYTFTAPGKYGFHDHLRPQFRGTIFVTDAQGVVPTLDCTNGNNAACFEEAIIKTLREDGVEAAFKVLTDFMEQYPTFTDDCHGYAHLIGEHAFSLFQNDFDFAVTPAATSCGYGFYHGFMGTLLLTTGDVALAQAFCKYVDDKATIGASATVSACYHGSGHGAVDGGDPNTWGDPKAMMAPGFALCAQLAESFFEEYLCHTGVYNAIEILSQDSTYQISYLRDDPFLLCVDEPIERQEACYTNWTPALLQFIDGDFLAGLDYIDQRLENGEVPTIEGYTTKEMVVLSFMHEYYKLNHHDWHYQTKGIELCRSRATDSDRLACIEGLSGGHIKYGIPNREYEQNLVFCSNTMLVEDEQNACYQHLLTRLQNRYDSETISNICQAVPAVMAERYCSDYQYE